MNSCRGKPCFSPQRHAASIARARNAAERVAGFFHWRAFRGLELPIDEAPHALSQLFPGRRLACAVRELRPLPLYASDVPEVGVLEPPVSRIRRPRPEAGFSWMPLPSRGGGEAPDAKVKHAGPVMSPATARLAGSTVASPAAWKGYVSGTETPLRSAPRTQRWPDPCMPTMALLGARRKPVAKWPCALCHHAAFQSHARDDLSDRLR